MNRLPPSRPVFPGSTQFEVPEPAQEPAAEPPWLLNGWIELTRRSRPGWRCLCETQFDLFCEVKRGPKFTLYRAVRRGPAVGDCFPVLEVCDVAMGPISQALIVVPVVIHRRDG